MGQSCRAGTSASHTPTPKGSRWPLCTLFLVKVVTEPSSVTGLFLAFLQVAGMSDTSELLLGTTETSTVVTTDGCCVPDTLAPMGFFCFLITDLGDGGGTHLNPSTQELQAGLETRGQPELHSKFQKHKPGTISEPSGMW